MNEQQKRAYIILHAELSNYDFGVKNWMAHEILQRAVYILKGNKVATEYYHVGLHLQFNKTIQMILHLTDMSIEDMIAVLEKLAELWKPR